MPYKQIYQTPEGFDDIVLVGEGGYLTGLYFVGSRDAGKFGECEEGDLPVFTETRKWLDDYFSGKSPDFTPKYRAKRSVFQREVDGIMLNIPFGKSLTYGEIAAIIAKKRGIAKMSARAVGGAVGSNPICLIVPCHRVLGASGKLTGYGGGIQNKIELLKHENIKYEKM